jgi:hypothetical protein
MTAHFDKLQALRNNPKLPGVDRPKLEEAFIHYKKWQDALNQAKGPANAIIESFIKSTNDYKRFIELDLIFDSEDDFLYRQKGQLKLDNTILEEFMPRLVDTRLVPGLASVANLIVGPQQCFSGFYVGPITSLLSEGGIFIKTKDQDFTVGRQLFLKASTSQSYDINTVESKLNIGYFVSEIKTNLDKTMFQEAAATARELKATVKDSRYVLLCEWLDMTPIDTRMTDIDNVILLRQAKRLSSNVRSNFSSVEGRRKYRKEYISHLETNPLSVKSFQMIVSLLNEAFPVMSELDENSVLSQGFF